jgi:hypothetical protein
LSVVRGWMNRFQPQATDLRPRTRSRLSFLARRPSAHGISLTEVLIAMGILTVGLLGVASLFPVGSFYMQKAEIADRGSAIAQSVMSDIISEGVLNPRAWMVMTPPNTLWPPGATILAADSQFSPTGAPVFGGFTRPFALALNEALQKPLASTNSTWIGKQFGGAYVIDPMGVAAMAIPGNGTPARWNIVSSGFPATAQMALVNGDIYSWPDWSLAWPVRRVTFQQPATGWPMDETTAGRMCIPSDDLVTDFPPRTDRPASQNWEIANVSGTSMPLSRQSRPDYSWIVTVAPTTKEAREGLSRDPESHSYSVSVVVFYKRQFPTDPGTVATATGSNKAFSDAIGESERAVQAEVVSTGLNGGELLLTDLKDNSTKSPFENLKTGQWIMLCGPHPNSSTSDPRFVLNWYQVLAIDGKDRRLNSQGTEYPAPPATDPERRLVTLRGPQWPWQPGGALSTRLCAGICRGAVAVHTKTLHLEGPHSTWSGPWGASAASGYVGGSGGGPPNGPKPPPNIGNPPVVVY